MSVSIRRANKYTPGKVSASPRGRVVHYKKEPYDFYVGRNAADYGVPAEKDADLGNPFAIIEGVRTRTQSIIKYEMHARQMVQFEGYRERVKSCHGKVLGCHCSPLPCHGTVILKLARELVERDGSVRKE